MAQKSKTQRAKASAARQARKEAAATAAAALEAEAADKGMTVAELQAANEAAALEEAKKQQKRSLFKKKDEAGSDAAKDKTAEKAKPKKERFKFLKDVRSEMKRVTWPSRQEVLRWSVVVVVALLFFGIYVAVLDNWVVTPILVLISGLGA